jgi:hypothetical protein
VSEPPSARRHVAMSKAPEVVPKIIDWLRTHVAEPAAATI